MKQNTTPHAVWDSIKSANPASITLLEVTERVATLCAGAVATPPTQRSVDRWLKRRGITPRGLSQKFRLFDRAKVEQALAEDFPVPPMDDVDAARAPRRSPAGTLTRTARKAGAR